jgi:hypothetical protein
VWQCSRAGEAPRFEGLPRTIRQREALLQRSYQEDAGPWELQRNPACLRITHPGEQLAPRRHEPGGVEQQHLREPSRADDAPFHDLLALNRRPTRLLAAYLAPEEIADFASQPSLPIRDPFDPRLFLRNHGFGAAEHMWVAQTGEET